MPQATPIIRIFVGSPGDVAEERKQAFKVIERLNGDPLLRGWRVEPVGWDCTPYANTTWLSPQKAIDERLARPSECDVALFILWSRIGTPLGDAEYPAEFRSEGLERAPTGTEWEFFDAMGAGEKTGRPEVLTFRCQRERTAKGGSDYQALVFLWQGVDAFFERFKDDQGSHRWSYTDYDSADDFADKLDAQLRDTIRTLTETGGGTKAIMQPRPKGPEVPSDYLRWLREKDTRIPLLGLDHRKPNTARLPQVYVPALSSNPIKSGGGFSGKITELLLNVLNERSIYVPGAPGAGKSVFCRWVAWVVAAGRMGEHAGEEPEAYRERLPRNLLGKLPLLVRLREFHGYVDCGRDAGSWSRAQLEDALAAWLEQKRPGGLRADTFLSNLEAGNCLLLLDGMDEVPVSREGGGRTLYPRRALVSGLADALGHWQKKGNRILLTSRPYGLEPEDTKALSLPEAGLAPLPEELQALFVARWFAAVDAAEADANTRGLLAQLGERPQLAELTGSPVLLNALCVKYDDGHRLPRDIYELYSSIVDRVLHSRYLEPHQRGGGGAPPPGGGGPGDAYGRGGGKGAQRAAGGDRP